ncbi:MAG: 50S ribosomal protein L18 [Candidatus Gracilibacteria bacterium]
MSTTPHQKRALRHRRIRTRVSGSAICPRLAVYRSNAYIYGQLIDDTTGLTLAAASDMQVKKGTKTERARIVGTELAKKAQVAGITKCVFDRGGFLYAGRISSLADAARESGLIF